MRHWKITLMRDGHCQRQWHLRGDSVAVGALPTCDVRLPRPAPDVLAELDGAQSGPHEFAWADAVVVIEDVTSQVNALLRLARTRIEAQPRRDAPTGQKLSLSLVGICLLLLAALLAPFLTDQRPQMLQALQILVAQQEAEELELSNLPLPVLEPTRPQASLPAGAQARVPLALAMVVGADLTKILRADGQTPHPSDGQHASDRDMILVPVDLSLSLPGAAYGRERALLYRSPAPSGLFEPG